MREDIAQGLLITLGIAATALFGVFVYQEIFPEYKIYQEDYVALEEFRSSYTGSPPPAFKYGVKQIVIEREDKGPPVIDRCTSCHVALQIPYFSPTKIAYDINGKIKLDNEGRPLQIPNPDYIWSKLDAKIDELTDEAVLKQLKERGENREISFRLKEAEKYQALKVAHVDEHIYDVTKVLRMHPLIGSETRPFEFHPVEEYGCVTCHSGNGRGLVTDRAHGPVLDGHYEIEYEGPVPQFTESDPDNDPIFSKEFNDKPGDRLLFQTTPILMGALIESQCVQCHAPSGKQLENIALSASQTLNDTQKRLLAIDKGLSQDKNALVSLLILRQAIEKQGYIKTFEQYAKRAADYALPAEERAAYLSQEEYLAKIAGDVSKRSVETINNLVLESIDRDLKGILGSAVMTNGLLNTVKGQKVNSELITKFLLDNRSNPDATGLVFAKISGLNYSQELIKHIQDTESSFQTAVEDTKSISALTSDVDDLTGHYKKGQSLYLSQACYACHKIAGFARGGVGPELTREGYAYPWFVKQSIVWPQADLRTSTMPNMKFDHEELEDLMTFVLAQKGKGNGVSDVAYKTAIQSWEEGKKLPWEKPATPTQMFDLRYSMTVFATQGCAACHRLEGFDSNIGFAIEKKTPSWEEIYNEKKWFQNIIPEGIIGSQLVSVLDKHKDEIDKRIVDHVRQGSLLEEIEANYPGDIETLYTPFKYAMRAKNALYANLIEKEKDPAKKSTLESEHKAWKERVHRVLMMFIQEYGLGRVIGPRPNWSGIYRSDQWLMEHFRKPTAHIPKSIMPVFPFDDTKFYALTYMLDTLGIRNRDQVRQIWDHRGFNPELAAHILCSQCHGEFLQGNGPVSEWIYPIPKNLRNADFLRNLTKEQAIQSITNGVKGTPMPPWGEVASEKHIDDGAPVLTNDEIKRLVDWLYSTLPGGGGVETEVPKWEYTPEDVIKELNQEKSELKSEPLSFLYQFNDGAYALAGLEPQISKKQELDVSTVFDIVPNPVPGAEKNAYYIKKQFYTQENLKAGKDFFEVNCAVCHGREGDGTGIRAEVMNDAKPRNFTNLDWLAVRDDLRLLRSIKYGVPGTSMVAWGDQSNSLQRLQLVMYIRSFAKDDVVRDKLMTSLYKGFDSALETVEKARIQEYAKLAELQKEYDQASEKEKALAAQVVQGKPVAKEAQAEYEKGLTISLKIANQESVDETLKKLKEEIAHEQELYKMLGLDLIGKPLPLDLKKDYFDDVASNQNRYTLVDGHLTIAPDAKQIEADRLVEQKILAVIDDQLKDLERQKEINMGKIQSTDRSQELDKIKIQTDNYRKLRTTVISNYEAARRSRDKQQELLKTFNETRQKKS